MNHWHPLIQQRLLDSSSQLRPDDVVALHIPHATNSDASGASVFLYKQSGTDKLQHTTELYINYFSHYNSLDKCSTIINTQQLITELYFTCLLLEISNLVANRCVVGGFIGILSCALWRYRSLLLCYTIPTETFTIHMCPVSLTAQLLQTTKSEIYQLTC